LDAKGRLSGCNADVLTVPGTLDLELHDAFRQCIEGVISTATDIFTFVELGAALTDNDIAGSDRLTAVDLDAKAFGV